MKKLQHLRSGVLTFRYLQAIIALDILAVANAGQRHQRQHCKLNWNILNLKEFESISSSAYNFHV